MPMVISTVVPSHIFARLASHLPTSSTTSFLLIINLSVLKIISFLGRLLLYTVLLILALVLLSQGPVHFSELVARNLNLANRPDSGQEIPMALSTVSLIVLEVLQLTRIEASDHRVAQQEVRHP